MNSKSFEMSLPQRREISHPVCWVCEFGNLTVFDAHLPKNMVLSFDPLGKLRRISIFLNFKIKFFSCCRNGHSCAVISEGEQNIESTKSFVPSIKIAFCHRKCMSQVQQSIHVGIWEGHEKFGLLGRFDRKILVAIPDGPSTWLKTDEFIPSDKALGFNFVVH